MTHVVNFIPPTQPIKRREWQRREKNMMSPWSNTLTTENPQREFTRCGNSDNKTFNKRHCWKINILCSRAKLYSMHRTVLCRHNTEQANTQLKTCTRFKSNAFNGFLRQSLFKKKFRKERKPETGVTSQDITPPKNKSGLRHLTLCM